MKGCMYSDDVAYILEKRCMYIIQWNP